MVKGHRDYSFASAWHPDGRSFATGSQDKTCRVWDVRNLTKPVTVLKGNMAAIRSLRFSTDGQFLAVAEAADFVNIYNTSLNYQKRHEIDLFGEIAGVSFSPDDETLFIGVSDQNYPSLLQFNKRHKYGYLDSFVWWIKLSWLFMFRWKIHRLTCIKMYGENLWRECIVKLCLDYICYILIMVTFFLGLVNHLFDVPDLDHQSQTPAWTNKDINKSYLSYTTRFYVKNYLLYIYIVFINLFCYNWRGLFMLLPLRYATLFLCQIYHIKTSSNFCEYGVCACV